MFPYFLMYGLIFFAIFISRIADFKNPRKVYCLVVFSALILLIGLRHPSMGIDLGYYRGYGYLRSFEKITAYSWKELLMMESFLNYEWGYVIFNKLVAMLTGGNQQVLLFLCALISIAPAAYTIYEKSDNLWLSAIIYMGIPPFMLLFSGLRQGLALGICFYALRYVEKREGWKFLATILVAYAFHQTAVVYLIAYPLYHVRMGQSVRWVTLGLIVLIYPFRVQLFTMFGRLFPSYSGVTNAGGNTLLVIFCMIYLFCCIFADLSDKRVDGYMNLFFLACVCQVFGTVSNHALRVGYYFILILPLLLPAILKGMKDGAERKLMTAVIMVCFLYQGWDSLSSTYWAMANPYYGFWENLLS